MKRPVIAIGWDAADPWLVDSWLAQDRLPNLKRLREEGAFGGLSNLEIYRAEAPWTTFLTGCLPFKTGHWGPIRYDANHYGAAEMGAYDFAEFPPFYALGEDFRIAAFDMPQSALANNVNGIQVTAWGAHSPQHPSGSTPEGLFSELIAKFGEHPALHDDYAICYDIADMRRLEQQLTEGVARRAAICRELLRRERWNLLLTAFGELHAAEHSFFHMSQPHPLAALKAPGAHDPMLRVFQATDQALGEIMAAAPEDAYVMAFSVHGMVPNLLDLLSMSFLPELLYRWNFPGRSLLPKGTTGRDPGPVRLDYPGRWSQIVWNMIPPEHAAGLPTSDEMEAAGDSLHWQPAYWLRPHWPRMKAFALPTYSEGHIRINLQGREARGVVAPEAYDAVCDEIAALLKDVVDARSGKRLVRDVTRTRRDPLDDDGRAPDADLVVNWRQGPPVDTVDSPRFGRIGPLPYLRTGSHRSRGFVAVRGPGIKAGSHLPDAQAMDLPPTILSLMGAPIGSHIDGGPIIDRPAAA